MTLSESPEFSKSDAPDATAKSPDPDTYLPGLGYLLLGVCGAALPVLVFLLIVLAT
jgi:hypothetical protein